MIGCIFCWLSLIACQTVGQEVAASLPGSSGLPEGCTVPLESGSTQTIEVQLLDFARVAAFRGVSAYSARIGFRRSEGRTYFNLQAEARKTHYIGYILSDAMSYDLAIVHELVWQPQASSTEVRIVLGSIEVFKNSS